MTTVTVYDTTAKELEKLSDKLDRTISDILEELVEDYGGELE